MKKNNMVLLKGLVTNEQKQWIKKQAKVNHVSIAEIVRDAIGSYMVYDNYIEFKKK